MDDLRERLERLAVRAEDEANAIERLRQARARGHRRRRIVAGSLAVIVAVGGLSFAYGALRTPRGIGPAVPTNAGVAYEPPAVPYLWPENWARNGTETPGDVQAEVDAGDKDVQWRTDPSEVASRFAKGVLGWEYVEASEMDGPADSPDSLLFGVTRDCPGRNCAVFGAEQFVRLVQPETRGKGGIWSVAAAWAHGLDVTTRPKDDPIDAFMPGSELPIHLNVPSDQTVVVGAVGQNGCSSFVSVDQDVSADYQLALPDALKPGDRGYDCGAHAASYVFAYTVPRLTVPTGDPFLEPAAITAVTAVPYVQVRIPGDVATATPSESTPDVASITCDGTTTTVLTPTVAAQSDGVHLTVENTASVSLLFETPEFRQDAPPGTTELVLWRTPRTQLPILCKSDAQGASEFTESVQIVDPNGAYLGDDLACPGGQQWSIESDGAQNSEGTTDLSAAARTTLGERVHEGDELRLAGYPASLERRVVLLVRDERAIAEVWFEPAPGGWLASSMNGCE